MPIVLNGSRGLSVTTLLVLHLEAQGLPLPVPEYRFAAPRRWRFDYAWPMQRVALEVDGGVWTGGRHTRGLGYLKDAEKLNHAACDGWKVLRVTPQQVRDGTAVQWIQRGLKLS